MRISDWSSDVCSSDLTQVGLTQALANNERSLMISAELWGVLILAAQNRVTLTREQLAELTGSDPSILNHELGQVASHCVSLHLPPLQLVVEPQTLEVVWEHDWTSQELPGREDGENSVFSARSEEHTSE